MLISALKLLSLTAIILLAGQIRVGNERVAEHFHGAVTRVLTKASADLKQTKAYTSFANSSLFHNWVNNVYPPVTAAAQQGSLQPAVEAVLDSATADSEEDTFTTSDRESILRLLD